MQTQVFTRDYQTPPPLKERVIAYLKTLLNSPRIKGALKNPKIITIASLLLTLIVLMLAMLSISARRTENLLTTQNTPVQILPPTPVATPSASQIETELKDFYKLLEDKSTSLNDLRKPIVELDLGFPK